MLYHVINDPIHGIIEVGSQEKNLVKPIIDTPIFQRLRNIRQLGAAEMVFPGAVHNRFSHSIGACFLARTIGVQLQLPLDQIELNIVAALVHDIGHGPYSHAFEKLLPLIFDDPNQVIHHESWSKYFLQSLTAEYPQLSELLAAVTALFKQETSDINYDLISSQLDADRLDYLLRDSHYCGVPYGKYDLQWIIHCLETVNHNGQQRLAINHKAVGAVEHYLLARRLMTRHVYYHPKIHAYDFYLVSFLKLLYQELLADNKIVMDLRHSPLAKFLLCLENFKADAKHEFISQAFPYYSQLTDIDISYAVRALATTNGNSEIEVLAQRLYQRRLPSVELLSVEQAELYKAKMPQLQQAAKYSWQLQILEPNVLAYQENEQAILVNYKDEVKTLAELSMLLSGILNKTEARCFLLRDQELLANQLKWNDAVL